jgi:hypothetical protein
MINGVRVRCSTVELSPTRSPQKWDQRRALDLLSDGTCLKSIVKQLGDYSIAAHDAEVRRVIFDCLGACRQIGDLDELNADARMICLGHRNEGRDEAIGRAARRTGRSADLQVIGALRLQTKF